MDDVGPQIKSSSGAYYWTVSSIDCQNVAKTINDGFVPRLGGFRHTIYLLMLAGF